MEKEERRESGREKKREGEMLISLLLSSDHVADVRPYGFGNEGIWRPQGVNSCLRCKRHTETERRKRLTVKRDTKKQ